MPNYLEYQKSIAQEFKAQEKRVRYLIDDANWAEEGRYKEVLLMNYLKRTIPKQFSVGTGFARNGDDITTQIDIIVYDNSYPPLFSEGDFVVVPAISVCAIVEVKSNIKSSEIKSHIEKANNNGGIIFNGFCDESYNNRASLFFNGIFSYNMENQFSSHRDNIQCLAPYQEMRIVRDKHYTNQICLGGDNFIRYWKTGEGHQYQEKNYSFYEFKNGNSGLAFSYFFSNLMYYLYSGAEHFDRDIPLEYSKFLFPVEGGKEMYKAYDAYMGDTQEGED